MSLVVIARDVGDPVFREAEAQIRRRRILDAPLSKALTRGNFVSNRLDSGGFYYQIGQPFRGVEPAHLAGG